MSKTIIELKCVDQVLTFVNTPIVASGGVGEDYLSIEFCSKWSGYTVSVFFWRQGVDPISVLADSDGLYKVPSELTYNEGVVYFGAVGVNADNERRTSEAISYRVHEGAITENTTLPDPDVDVFDQLLAQYADVKLYVASSVESAASSAAIAEEKASSAASSAKNATIVSQKALSYIGIPIYPGVVQAVMQTSGNVSAYCVPLSEKPPENMFLVYRVPNNNGNGLQQNAFYITYTDENGEETKDLVWLNDQENSTPVSGTLKHRDIVVVLLRYTDGGETKNAYILNPRLTSVISESLDKKAETVTYRATVIPSGWTKSGSYYYQDITVDGILESDDPIVGVYLYSDDMDRNAQQKSDFGNIILINTYDGSIRVWAKKETTIDFMIRLKVVR